MQNIFFKRMMQSVVFFSCFLLLGAAPAWANSGYVYWEGTDANGLMVQDTQCPLIVEYENLSFDIQAFPESSYEDVSQFAAYTGKVTAEYHFYNPADYKVSVELLFPFGALPEYLEAVSLDAELEDLDRYAITVDGGIVEKQLKYSVITPGEAFDAEAAMQQLMSESEAETIPSETKLMRWFVYHIEAEPGARVVNTVTAPLYPGINGSTDPDSYDYTYLFSPARSWAAFGKLNIHINTPFYLQRNKDHFTAVDTGYALELETLPEEELHFTLSTVESAKSRGVNIFAALGLFLLTGVISMLGILVLIGVAIAVIVLLIIAIVTLIRKKKDRK